MNAQKRSFERLLVIAFMFLLIFNAFPIELIPNNETEDEIEPDPDVTDDRPVVSGTRSNGLHALYVGNTDIDIAWSMYTGENFSSYRVLDDGFEVRNITEKTTTSMRFGLREKHRTYTFRVEVYDKTDEVVSEDEITVKAGEVRGTIRRNTMWDKSEGPFNLTDDIVIENGTLTIFEGVEIRGDSKWIETRNGSLSDLMDATLIDTRISVKNHSSFTVKNCNLTNSRMEFVSCENFHVDGLNMTGSSIASWYTNRSLFTDNTIYGSGEAISLIDAYNSTVSGNTFNNTNEPIYLERSDNSRIYENWLYNSDEGIISQDSDNLDIYKNLIENADIGISLFWVSYVNIHNNTITIGDKGVILEEAYKVKVVNNSFSWIANSVVNAVFSDNCTFSDTIGKITLEFCSNNSVTNHTGFISLVESDYNWIWNNGMNGTLPGVNTILMLDRSDLNVIKDNYFFNNSWNGISLSSSHNNTIDNNTIRFNEQGGISLINSDGNAIYRNNVTNNTLDGILAACTKNSIKWNNVSGNGGSGIRVSGPNNTINSNTIRMNDHGIHLTGSMNSIEMNTILENVNDGIHLYSGSSENVIRENNISENKHGLFLFGDCNENLISENQINGNQYYGIYFQLPSIENIINENNITQTGLEGSIYADAIHFHSASTNTSIWDNQIISNYGTGMILKGTYFDIARNIVNYNSGYGIYLIESSNSTVNNNTVHSNEREGIYLAGSGRNDITLNTVTFNQRGIYLLSNGEDSYIVDNQVKGNAVQGIYIRDSIRTFITGNNASLNQIGISISGSSSINISENQVWYNEEHGIQLWECDSSWVFDNTISGNTNGIRLWASFLNEIYQNGVTNNTYGIDLWEYSDHNNFTANTIKDNDWGIYIWGFHASDGNLIYDNYFRNTVNAYDHSDNHNIWNISKTAGMNIVYGLFMGGNYWDDYIGNDTDGDFLGDSSLPHTSGGNIANGGDLHPLLPRAAQVRNQDTGIVYTTISDALYDGATSDGHTILVGPGEYVEDFSVIKAVTIQSTNGPEATIIRPSMATEDAVLMTEAGAMIIGFTVTGSTGLDKAGVRIFADNCYVTNCIVTGNYHGIFVQSNIISSFNIETSTISDNQGHGIFAEYMNTDKTIFIQDSTITENGGAGVFSDEGARIGFVGRNIVTGNDCGIGAGSAIRGEDITIDRLLDGESFLRCNNNAGNGIEAKMIMTIAWSAADTIEVKGNDGHGILKAVDINLRNADISGNGKDGINSQNKQKVVIMLSQCTINGNKWDGINTEGSTNVHLLLEADPSIAGSTAVTENKGTGIRLGKNGVVDVIGPSLVGHNLGNGIYAGAVISYIGIHEHARLDVSTNGGTGIFTEAGGDTEMFLKHITSPGSVSGGEISSFNNGQHGIYAEGNVGMNIGLFSNNVHTGIVCYGELALTSVKIMGNGVTGIWTLKDEETRSDDRKGGTRADNDDVKGTIFDCIISENIGTAIKIEDGSIPGITSNTITSNGNGIHCTNGSSPLIRYNTFKDNTGFDLRNDDPAVTINAKLNWWGTPDGTEAEIIGDVDSSSPLASEVDGTDVLIMNGNGLTDLLNDSLSIDYSVQTGSNTTLTVLRFKDVPVGTLENATGDVYLAMVDPMPSVNEIIFRIHYQDTVVPNDGDEERLTPHYWDDDWQEFSDWNLDSGNGDSSIMVTINASTLPDTITLEQLYIALALTSEVNNSTDPQPHDEPDDDGDEDSPILIYLLVFMMVIVLLILFFKNEILERLGGEEDGEMSNKTVEVQPGEMNRKENPEYPSIGSGNEKEGIGITGSEDPMKMTKADIIESVKKKNA